MIHGWYAYVRVTVYVCLCACVGNTNPLRQASLLSSLPLLDLQPNLVEYKNSSRRLQVNLAHSFVMMLPSTENMLSWAAEVEDTVRNFLAKRAIHATI